jgi:hypothetical protein
MIATTYTTPIQKERTCIFYDNNILLLIREDTPWQPQDLIQHNPGRKNFHVVRRLNVVESHDLPQKSELDTTWRIWTLYSIIFNNSSNIFIFYLFSLYIIQFFILNTLSRIGVRVAKRPGFSSDDWIYYRFG